MGIPSVAPHAEDALRRSNAGSKERAVERLYVVGGLDSAYEAVDTVECYDPAKGHWDILPSINAPCHGACAIVAQGILYVLGGEVSGDALGDAQCFDPEGAQTWEQLPHMSFGRIKAAAVECQDCLYVMGGLDGFNALCSVERFDPKTCTWKEVAPMHRPRYGCSATCTQDGHIIVFGGELTEEGRLASVEVYSPEDDAWQLLPTIRSPLTGSAVVLTESGDAALSFGGLGLSGQALTFAERAILNGTIFSGEAKPNMPIWSPLPTMRTARQQMSACAFMGGAVAVGGKSANSEASDKVEAFGADGFWTELPPLSSSRLRPAVASGRF
eukprot:TRINITY_DN78224_c0_g1_i1.p1 TRINITY_DN78224_c0_g1~~TRINITY_DN78224_c0_g1_i1.p1  ORF type:complete len:328 (-),score=65.25 TRINITY_DN78224_c0_g1_i1:120-1103(-)